MSSLVLGGAVVALPAAAGAAITDTPEPATGLTATANFDEAKLTWSGSPTLGATTVIRGKAGTAAPTSSTDGFAVQQADISMLPTATASDLEPGTPYSFAVFACNGTDCAAPATVTLDSYRILKASLSPDRTTYGKDVAITGQVVDYMTGVPIDYADMRVVAHTIRTDEIYVAAEDYARGGNGQFNLAATPPERTEYAVFAFGDATHLGGYALTRAVSVSADVGLFPRKQKNALGTTFTMVGGADPLNITVPYQLQEQIKGKWKNVVKKKPATKGKKKGIATFKIKPTTKGKHTYRVYRGATPGVSGGYSKTATLTVT